MLNEPYEVNQDFGGKGNSVLDFVFHTRFVGASPSGTGKLLLANQVARRLLSKYQAAFITDAVSRDRRAVRRDATRPGNQAPQNLFLRERCAPTVELTRRREFIQASPDQ